MILAISDSGAGFVIFMFYVLLVFALLGWVIYWAERGFRASPRRKPWKLMAMASFVVVTLCFPPMRIVGVWVHKSTGLPIPPSDQSPYDRNTYGYIPTYQRVSAWGKEVEGHTGHTVKLDERGPYEVTKAYWQIDWWFLIGQIIAVVLLLLPFVRARLSGGSREAS